MTAIAQFVGALAALIIIHELGHFFASRLLGVEVEEFGLGFPPRARKLWRGMGRLRQILRPRSHFRRARGL